MLKIMAKLEHKIGERAYQMICDHDAPLGEVKEALSQFLGHIVNVEKSIAEAAAKEQAASAPAIEPSEIEVPEKVEAING